MRLCCFGCLQIEGLRSERLSPQLLLLLAYLRLEGVRARAPLAALFWPYSQQSYTQKGERKDLKNLSSALATLRRETGINPEDGQDLATLPCDVSEFWRLLKAGKNQEALALFQEGIFLADIEHRPRLHLGDELLEWLENTRDRLQAMASRVLLEQAEAAMREGDAATVSALAESLHRLGEVQLEPALLSRLYQLLLYAGSDLASAVRQKHEGYLQALLGEGFLDETSFELLLCLSLQGARNLNLAAQVCDLSPKQLSMCLEQLIANRLLGPNHEVLVAEMAQDHLAQYPALRLSLLGRLRDLSPKNEALSYYRSLFQTTQGFGGLGYLQKAKQIYAVEVLGFLEQDNYQAAIELLEELQRAEGLQQQADATIAFYHAYTLERLRQPQAALELIESVSEGHAIDALRSSLLLSQGELAQSRSLAEFALAKLSARRADAWPQALAYASLGQIAYREKDLARADYYYEHSVIAWQRSGFRQRELGARMNRAIILGMMGESDAALRDYAVIIDKAKDKASLKVSALLNMGFLYESLEDWPRALEQYQSAYATMTSSGLAQQDKALYAHLLNNLGYAHWKLEDVGSAQDYFQRGLELSADIDNRHIYASLLGNLGAVQQDFVKLEAALQLFTALEQPHNEAYLNFYRQALTQSIDKALARKDIGAELFYRGRLHKLESERTPHH